jgi:hypothetical protein
MSDFAAFLNTHKASFLLLSVPFLLLIIRDIISWRVTILRQRTIEKNLQIGEAIVAKNLEKVEKNKRDLLRALQKLNSERDNKDETNADAT